MKCTISSKSKEFVPNISSVKCLRGLRYSYDGDEIKLHPSGSVTKSCGPFFDYFPQARDAEITAKCTANACYLSKPNSFIIVPYQKVACQKKMWQVAKVEITTDPEWQALSFDEYSEFDVFGTNKNGEKLTTLAITCGRETIWDFIQPHVDPSFSPGNGPKPTCSPNKSSTKTECYFHCPGKTQNSPPTKLNIKLQCKVKTGLWEPLTARQIEKMRCD